LNSSALGFLPFLFHSYFLIRDNCSQTKTLIYSILKGKAGIYLSSGKFVSAFLCFWESSNPIERFFDEDLINNYSQKLHFALLLYMLWGTILKTINIL